MKTKQCQDEDDCQTPTWCRGKNKCPRAEEKADDLLGATAGSPSKCDTCHHWEYDDARHGFMSGYCPIFQKVTHNNDGTKCTAWEKIHLE